MKNKILALLASLFVLVSPLTVFGLGDNPINLPPEPDIVKVTLSSTSHVENTVGSVDVTVDTSNVADETAVTVQLVQSDGVTAVTGVSTATGKIVDDTAKPKLSIPVGIAGGSYKIRVSISTLNLSESVSYTITAGAQPSITSVTADTSSHVSGTQQNVSITVLTQNVSNGTSATVRLVDGSGTAVNGVTAATGEINSNSGLITLTIPSSVASGSYFIKVTVNTATHTSTAYTITTSSNDPAILGTSISSSVQNVETAATVTITVNTQYIDNGTDVVVSLTSGDGTSVSGVLAQTVDVNGSTNKATAQLTIPDTVPRGTYYIKAQIASPALTHKTTVYKVTQPQPSISGISAADTSLVVSGTNFSKTASNNSISILDASTSNVVATVTPSQASATSLTVSIPSDLAAGTYKVKVTVGGKFTTSSGTFAVAESGGTGDTGGTGDSGGDTGSIIPMLPESSATPLPETTPVTTIDPDSGKAVTSYTNTIIGEKIAALGNDKKKEIQLELPQVDVSAREVVIDEKAVGSIAANKVDVNIKTSDVILNIPSNVFSDLSTSLIKISIKSIKDEEKKTLAGSIPQKSIKSLSLTGPVMEFNIKASKGSNEQEITKFKSKITITMDLSGMDLTSANVKKLGVYYLNEKDMIWEYVGGKYNKKTGSIEAKTNHFTKFAVMEYTKTFADVSDNSWAKEYIEMLAARNITQGVDENNFDPSGVVTRAQFTTFLVKALNLELGSYRGRFGDVAEGQWYTLYIEAAENAGLVSGNNDGTFKPGYYITREQMAVMVMNAYNYLTSKNVAQEAKKSKSKFNDESKISSWAKDAVYAAQANGIIGGLPGNVYSPSDNAKREQAARVIIGLLEVLGEI